MTVRRLVIGVLLALAVLAVPLQVIIDSSVQNIASACVVLASSMSILLYIGWTRALEIEPVSTFTVFGFCVTTQLGALLAQTAAWTALRSSLYAPLYTFGTLAFYQAIAMGVHAAYCFLPARRPTSFSPVRWVLDRAGLYRTPDAGVLWVMGVMGLVSFSLYGDKGVVGKISDAFQFLTWAPFLIPLYWHELGDSYCNAKRTAPFLIMYALIICLLGVAVNARGIMFLGVVTIGLSYLLLSLRSRAPVTVNRGTLLKLGALIAVGFALAGPMSDLATAMAIARAHRGKVSTLEMMESTFDAWRSPYLIARYRAMDKAALTTAYDETYIANPVIARFVETKFHDNALHFAGLLSTEDSKARLRHVTVASLWAVLPSPILKALRVPPDKDQLNFSMGDYILYLSRGLPLGGRKAGSVFAEGITLAGPLFPFVYAGLCLAIFMLMSLLTVKPISAIASMSALARMQAWGLFNDGIVGESIASLFTFIARQCFQMMLVYVFAFTFASIILYRRQPAGTHSGALDGKYGR
jgi:hypothetical protein